MVVAAPSCASDAWKAAGPRRGYKKILSSLLDLAESFIAEFFRNAVLPNVRSCKDYCAAASAFQWLTRSIMTVMLNEHTKERVKKAIHVADNLLFELATQSSEYMESIFIYPTNLPLFDLCSDRFGSFPRPADWDQKGTPPGHTVGLRPLPFRFMPLAAEGEGEAPPA